MSVYVFDVETDVKENPRIIEAAWIKLGGAPQTIIEENPSNETFSRRYNPQRPLSPATMAVHHIIDADLQDAPDYTTFELPSDVAYLVGHNVEFDWRVAGSPDVRCICTYHLAKRLWPQLDGFSLGALLYQFLPAAEARQRLKEAHHALTDVENCLLLLQVIYRELASRRFAPETWEKLWQFSEAAKIPEIMGFGKHKGLAIKDLPLDYIQWYLRQENPDPYYKIAFERRLRA